MVKNTSDKNANELERLRKENASLKNDLEKLKTGVNNTRRIDWRGVGKWTSIVLASALFVVASFMLYATLSLVNTDRFVNIAGPLIEKPAVQKAIATKTTDALFERANLEQLAADALPERIDFLAPTIENQAKSYTQQTIENVIKSEGFQSFWQSSLRKSHNRLITDIRDYKGDGTISIEDVYTNLQGKVKDPKLQFLQDVKLPSRIGNVTVLQVDWLPQASYVVSNIYVFRVLAIALFAVLLTLSIWLGRDRRKTFMQIGAILAVLSIIMLFSIRVARMSVLGDVNPQYEEAANDIWAALTQPFAWQLVASMVIALAVIVVAWVGGDSKTAAVIRKKFDDIFAGKFHKALFAKENGLTIWTEKHKKALMTVVGAGFVISLFIIKLDPLSLILAAVVSIVLVIIIDLLSADNTKSVKQRRKTAKNRVS